MCKGCSHEAQKMECNKQNAQTGHSVSVREWHGRYTPVIERLGREVGPKRWEGMEAGPCSALPENPIPIYLNSQVPLHTRFEALELKREVSEDVVKGPSMRLSRVRRSTPHLKTASTKNKKRVIVIGNSFLRGTEGPICQPDPTNREVCCLLRPQDPDITRKLSGLVCPSC